MRGAKRGFGTAVPKTTIERPGKLRGAVMRWPVTRCDCCLYVHTTGRAGHGPAPWTRAGQAAGGTRAHTGAPLHGQHACFVGAGYIPPAAHKRAATPSGERRPDPSNKHNDTYRQASRGTRMCPGGLSSNPKLLRPPPATQRVAESGLRGSAPYSLTPPTATPAMMYLLKQKYTIRRGRAVMARPR